MNFYIYLSIAFLCFALEMFTMEFSMTCVGNGLLGGAYASYLGYGIWWQAGVFALLAITAWLTVRPLALKFLFRKTKSIKTPAQNVIGQEAVVEIALDPTQKTGRVKVLGESWKAFCEEPLPVGAKCRVEKLDGVTLFVKKI